MVYVTILSLLVFVLPRWFLSYCFVMFLAQGIIHSNYCHLRDSHVWPWNSKSGHGLRDVEMSRRPWRDLQFSRSHVKITQFAIVRMNSLIRKPDESGNSHLGRTNTSSNNKKSRRPWRDLRFQGSQYESSLTDWGLRSFAVAGPSSWNALPVSLRSSSFSLDTFAKHLKTHLFGIAYSRQGTHFWVCITFCRVRHGDSVTKPDYYYYYYYYYLTLGLNKLNCIEK